MFYINSRMIAVRASLAALTRSRGKPPVRDGTPGVLDTSMYKGTDVANLFAVGSFLASLANTELAAYQPSVD